MPTLQNMVFTYKTIQCNIPEEESEYKEHLSETD
jgi:hypothetical protein